MWMVVMGEDGCVLVWLIKMPGCSWSCHTEEKKVHDARGALCFVLFHVHWGHVGTLGLYQQRLWHVAKRQRVY